MCFEKGPPAKECIFCTFWGAIFGVIFAMHLGKDMPFLAKIWALDRSNEREREMGGDSSESYIVTLSKTTLGRPEEAARSLLMAFIAENSQMVPRFRWPFSFSLMVE